MKLAGLQNGQRSIGYLTIGRFRDDGDFDVFATLNNDTFELLPEVLAKLANELRLAIEDGVILSRQDSPDVISPELEDFI